MHCSRGAVRVILWLGSEDPWHDHQDKSSRARNVLLFPAGCHGDLQLSGLLRRGGPVENSADVYPGRLLVGYCYHDDGRLR